MGRDSKFVEKLRSVNITHKGPTFETCVGDGGSKTYTWSMYWSCRYHNLHCHAKDT